MDTPTPFINPVPTVPPITQPSQMSAGLKIALAIGALVVIGVAGYWLGNRDSEEVVVSPMPTETLAISSTPTSSQEASVSADWKTYTNTQYGFEFRYPADWYISDQGETGISLYEHKVGPSLPGVTKSIQIN